MFRTFNITGSITLRWNRYYHYECDHVHHWKRSVQCESIWIATVSRFHHYILFLQSFSFLLHFRVCNWHVWSHGSDWYFFLELINNNSTSFFIFHTLMRQPKLIFIIPFTPYLLSFSLYSYISSSMTSSLYPSLVIPHFIYDLSFTFHLSLSLSLHMIYLLLSISHYLSHYVWFIFSFSSLIISHFMYDLSFTFHFSLSLTLYVCILRLLCCRWNTGILLWRLLFLV